MNSKNKELSEYIAMEKQSFSHLVDKLEEIREEIHKTNSQMREFNSSQKLELVETKAEIYATCFHKLVEKVEYVKDMEEVKNSVKNKVDKTSVNLIWAIFTTLAAVFIAYLEIK